MTSPICLLQIILGSASNNIYFQAVQLLKAMNWDMEGLLCMLVKFTTCFGDNEVRTMSSKHLSSTASHRNYYSFCLSSYIPSLSAFRGTTDYFVNFKHMTSPICLLQIIL
jgi:hypothetical protein